MRAEATVIRTAKHMRLLFKSDAVYRWHLARCWWSLNPWDVWR